MGRLRPRRIASRATNGASEIETELQNEGFEAGTVEIVSEIVAPGGKMVVSAQGKQRVGAKSAALNKQKMTVEKPKLWSLEKRALYVLRTTLRKSGKIIDKTETTFGFREIHFTPDKGFFSMASRSRSRAPAITRTTPASGTRCPTRSSNGGCAS
jgi:beta-galactosidase